jgi:hypothetical protein
MFLCLDGVCRLRFFVYECMHICMCLASDVCERRLRRDNNAEYVPMRIYACVYVCMYVCMFATNASVHLRVQYHIEQ